MTGNNKSQQQDKKVIASGSIPDSALDVFADALVEFILAVEQEEKEKSA